MERSSWFLAHLKAAIRFIWSQCLWNFDPFYFYLRNIDRNFSRARSCIRGVSEKYPTCVHISALVLFFVIRTVASFEVVPIWLNRTLPAVLPHLKTVLERRFWNGLQLARRITLNRLDVVKPLSFERHFQFWEHPKVAGSYVGTVQRLAKLYNLVLRQKLLHKVRWMRSCVIMVKKPVTAWPETRSFSSHGITQSFQNFNVIFFVDRLISWSEFVAHNTLIIEKKDINAGRILFGHTSYYTLAALIDTTRLEIPRVSWIFSFKLLGVETLPLSLDKLRSDNYAIKILQNCSVMQPLIPVWRLYPASLETVL